MKLILVILFSVIALTAFAVQPSVRALKQLDQIEIDKQKNNWKFNTGYSEVMEIPLDQLTGLKIPNNWKTTATFMTPKAKFMGTLPAHFDWRDNPNGLPPVKNQGRCGSCWAFGTVAPLESIIRIRENRTDTLSEQELVSCSGYGSCAGGYFAHGYHQKRGAALDNAFPYRAYDAGCQGGLKSVANIESWAYIGNRWSTPSVSEIKQAIYEHGPVGVTITASDYMKAYTGGIYQACSWGRTNHIVALVGWDDSQRVWIMRNSWGANWGEQGYMRIPWGCSRVGEMATFVNYKAGCQPQPQVFAGTDVKVKRGDWVNLGSLPVVGQSYKWSPSTGLDDPNSSMPIASPSQTTQYTLTVENQCGRADRTITVTVE